MPHRISISPIKSSAPWEAPLHLLPMGVEVGQEKTPWGKAFFYPIELISAPWGVLLTHRKPCWWGGLAPLTLLPMGVHVGREKVLPHGIFSCPIGSGICPTDTPGGQRLGEPHGASLNPLFCSPPPPGSCCGCWWP